MKREIIELILAKFPTRSAWARGVKATAADLLEGLADDVVLTKEALLNGAQTWKEWSEGGCGLIYDADIAKRFCSPSEFKKTREGERQPNNRETWLDVQARAAYQAASKILHAVRV